MLAETDIARAAAGPPVAVVMTALALRVIRGSAHHFTMRVSDWMMSGMLFTCGYLLMGYVQPDGKPIPVMLVLLTAQAPVHVWGLCITVVSSLRLFALFINGTFPQFCWSPHIRMVTAFLSCFIWFQMALVILTTNLAVSPMMVVFPWLFLFDVYNTWLAAREAGLAERSYRNGG